MSLILFLRIYISYSQKDGNYSLLTTSIFNVPADYRFSPDNPESTFCICKDLSG